MMHKLRDINSVEFLLEIDKYYICVGKFGDDPARFYKDYYPNGTIVRCISQEYFTNNTPFSTPPKPSDKLSCQSGLWEEWSPGITDVSLEDYL